MDNIFGYRMLWILYLVIECYGYYIWLYNAMDIIFGYRMLWIIYMVIECYGYYIWL